jgi:hypothetical protein
MLEDLEFRKIPIFIYLFIVKFSYKLLFFTTQKDFEK